MEASRQTRYGLVLAHKIFTKAPGLCLLFLLFGLLWFWYRQFECVRGLVHASTDLLPGTRTTLKVAERLCELQGFCDNTLLLLVVTDLGIPGEREILAQRMTLEAIVSHDTTKVGMAREEDAEHVVDLTLIPIGTVENANQARDRRGLVSVRLDSDAGIVTDAQQIVDDLESLVAGWEVDGRDIANLRELGCRIVWAQLASKCSVRGETELTYT